MTRLPEEEIRRVFRAAPFIADLGIELESVARGECVTVLGLTRRHQQQDGFVHAGVHATIADHTAGGAAATLIGDGQYVLSAEFKINLLRATRCERLRCRARVLKPGRRLIVAESEVFDADDAERLLSKAIVTLAVVTSG